MKLFVIALGLIGASAYISGRALPGEAGFHPWIPISLAACIVGAMACMSLAMFRVHRAVLT